MQREYIRGHDDKGITANCKTSERWFGRGEALSRDEGMRRFELMEALWSAMTGKGKEATT